MSLKSTVVVVTVTPYSKMKVISPIYRHENMAADYGIMGGEKKLIFMKNVPISPSILSGRCVKNKNYYSG